MVMLGCGIKPLAILLGIYPIIVAGMIFVIVLPAGALPMFMPVGILPVFISGLLLSTFTFDSGLTVEGINPMVILAGILPELEFTFVLSGLALGAILDDILGIVMGAFICGENAALLLAVLAKQIYQSRQLPLLFCASDNVAGTGYS